VIMLIMYGQVVIMNTDIKDIVPEVQIHLNCDESFAEQFIVVADKLNELDMPELSHHQDDNVSTWNYSQ